MEWISIKNRLPTIGIEVDLCCVEIKDNSTLWTSTGWLTKHGFWSIKHSQNVTLLSKPTHWLPTRNLITEN